MKIKAVLFDLGGTLIKTAEVQEIFRRILAAYGIKVDSDRILEAHRANEKQLDFAAGTAEEGIAFWNKWNLTLLRRLGIEKDARFLAAKITELWWEYADLEFYPDVLDTLAQLKAKQVKTGIITNGLKQDYEQALRKLDATDLFEVTVGVDACNSAKPDKRIFLHAVKKLSLKPAEALFIGDSLEKDYEGARKAGLKSLLIDRKARTTEKVDSIMSLTEVLLYL